MKRLYYESSYIKTFQAKVTGCREGKNGQWDVTLDQTAFFPEGGGQPWDTGTLGEARVLEVHERGEEVIHRTDRPLAVGASVEGTIDWERRFDNMQGHSGEHIITGCIHRRFGYDNVGFHMGSEEITIDFNGLMSETELEEMELEANEAIWRNLPIQILTPSEEELKSMEYRSKKELSGQVRIAVVPGVDVCACCGTHVERTGEVGLIKVLGMIHYKGGVRISLLCGRRALIHCVRRQKQVASLSALLAAKQDEVETAVARLKEEKERLGAEISRMRQAEAEAKADALPESRDPLAVFEEMEPVQLRKYCDLLCERKKGEIVLVCSPKGEGYQYAVASRSRDMRAFSRKLNERLNGRGGGSSQMAQGTFGAGKEEIESAFFASAEEEMK
ncbi:MAG TPA: alanyl-tRNA editing protein [Candidatus Lachnoclostridium stercorigallinarum]|uniref:Alanyl-tRNA editing protein n=1 Tax=Candidatus Lachnoclostridium stercorigallinarum TaxID=2838634 RepID=A0A9D2GHN7_9FIRM|nr:alanyl-tRNA editing protein [Candidatus Lachnoclostridium stercorigallinarum]